MRYEKRPMKTRLTLPTWSLGIGASAMIATGSLLLFAVFVQPLDGGERWSAEPEFNPLRPAMVWLPQSKSEAHLARRAVARTMVNNDHWQAVMTPDRPMAPTGSVARVTFDSARLYCNRLSLMEGLEPCYSIGDCSGQVVDQSDMACARVRKLPQCEGYRLPTRAEWAKVERSGPITDALATNAPSNPAGHAPSWQWIDSGERACRPSASGCRDSAGDVGSRAALRPVRTHRANDGDDTVTAAE